MLVRPRRDLAGALVLARRDLVRHLWPLVLARLRIEHLLVRAAVSRDPLADELGAAVVALGDGVVTLLRLAVRVRDLLGVKRCGPARGGVSQTGPQEHGCASAAAARDWGTRAWGARGCGVRLRREGAALLTFVRELPVGPCSPRDAAAPRPTRCRACPPPRRTPSAPWCSASARPVVLDGRVHRLQVFDRRVPHLYGGEHAASLSALREQLHLFALAQLGHLEAVILLVLVLVLGAGISCRSRGGRRSFSTSRRSGGGAGWAGLRVG
eukprot:1893597-Prymnesium_polylepis.1